MEKDAFEYPDFETFRPDLELWDRLCAWKERNREIDRERLANGEDPAVIQEGNSFSVESDDQVEVNELRSFLVGVW